MIYGLCRYRKTITSENSLEAKIVQLQDIEQKVGRVEDTGLADIDSSSPFTATYVIHFKRGLLEPRKYQIGFDVEYMDTAASGRSAKTASASSVVQISPSPIALSFVTVIATIFGTTVKILLASNQSQNSGAALSISSVPEMLNSPQMLVGPIVALIFFNIYEKTSSAKGMSLSVNWRSALLIGALCGLAYERILGALKALIGA